VLKRLIEKKLADYIALDIKAPLTWEKYKRATNIEFRTTFVPKLMTSSYVITIAKQLKGAKRYALQQFIPRTTVAKRFERIEPYKQEILKKLGKEIKNMFQNFELRNV